MNSQPELRQWATMLQREEAQLSKIPLASEPDSHPHSQTLGKKLQARCCSSDLHVFVGNAMLPRVLGKCWLPQVYPTHSWFRGLKMLRGKLSPRLLLFLPPSILPNKTIWVLKSHLPDWIQAWVDLISFFIDQRQSSWGRHFEELCVEHTAFSASAGEVMGWVTCRLSWQGVGGVKWHHSTCYFIC